MSMLKTLPTKESELKRIKRQFLWVKLLNIFLMIPLYVFVYFTHELFLYIVVFIHVHLIIAYFIQKHNLKHLGEK